MTIGFVPLDTRPCTFDFPVQLARQKGAQVLLPPAGIMGFYKTGADTAAVARWLEEIAARCDALVVSAEQLLYGGLIQSRQARLSEQEIEKTMDVLRRIRRSCPSVRIFLSNVLMRASISILDAVSAAWWEKVNAYSVWAYRAQTTHAPQAEERCSALKREIPPDILQNFLAARGQNHAANLACLRLAGDGTADRVLILQEDCAPEGLQRFEQEALLREIERRDLGGRVFLFNGTDEAGAELVLHALCPDGCEAEIVWLGQQTNFIANYEDRPFGENLSGHMRALSIRAVPGAGCALCILPPKAKQREAFEPRAAADDADYTKEELQAICKTLRRLVGQGRRCYLLDLNYSNGGDAELLRLLAREIPICSLHGYAAWNTASNSLGTILAQMLAGDGENAALNQCFTAERVLDDCLYQSLVRPLVEKRAREKGIEIHNISDIPMMEQWIIEAYHSIRPQTEEIFCGKVPEFCVRLRWPRLFEAAVFTKDGGGPVYSRPSEKNGP